MYVHDFPNLAPSVCFMCEQAEHGVRYVDTMLNFNTDAYTSKLAGRKYVCERCVRDYAEILGMFDEARENAKRVADQAEQQIREVEERLEAFTHLEGVLKTLTKPKTPVKKAATPAKEE